MISSRQQSGGTLLEVLISLSLLIGGILAYFQLDAKLISENRQALQKSQAVQLLQQQMERLAQTTAAGNSGVEPIEINGNQYQIDWSVESSGPQKTVRIVVSWENKAGKTTEQTKLALTGHYLHQNRLALALIPPPNPIRPDD